MTSLDFTDIFKKNNSQSRENHFETMDENIPPKSEISQPLMDISKPSDNSDLQIWVSNQLRSLSYNCSEKDVRDLPSSVLRCLHGLVQERSHWQLQTSAISEECNKLRYELSSAIRDKQKESDSSVALVQEIKTVNGKMESMRAEHREARNHWLHEKTELEKKFFEIQAQQTQMSGTMRKKEKDFERLQLQLEKTVKGMQKTGTSSKTSASATASIVISKPLPKNLSQVKPTATLRDAEMQALDRLVKSLEQENQTLCTALANTNDSISELNRRYDITVAHNEAQRQANEEMQLQLQREQRRLQNEIESVRSQSQTCAASVPHTTQINYVRTSPVSSSQMVSNSSVLTPQHDKESGFPRTTPSLESSKPTVSSSTACTPGRTVANMRTPGSIARRFLEGTPGARHITWLVDQVNTEVKKLRNRAEMLNVNSPGQVGNNLFGENCTALSENDYLIIRQQLAEAMIVIREQDRLIHEALMGNISNMKNSQDDVSSQIGVAWEEDEDDYDVAGVWHASRAIAGTDKTDWDIDNDLDNFLPPASPATIAVLQSCGWSCLPPSL